ncbi:MAG: hypothetical protein JWN13_2456 [Betaproteobacteria bacterium]|jgi:uncharacterized protein YecE (DUF72 family)|nr:hypothetical protein [Betaproteobacteria bacterium]
MKILVGTCSWTDKTLIDSGNFYPEDVKTPEARLKFYASKFPIVEVDSSYYAIPSERTAKQWAERTPDDFVFDVKAFRLLTTHQTQPKVLPKHVSESLPVVKKTVYYKDLPRELVDAVWSEFRAALRPLKDSGKLGLVLFQFPPWFLPHKESLAHIEECIERMEGYQLAVEFRHQTWFLDKGRERTLAFERKHGLANVIVDEPQGLKTSIPPVWEVTNGDVAMVRLHGRNHSTWERKGLKAASERFDYWYDRNELKKLVPEIKGLEAKKVHVLFNVNHQDQGQKGAATLQSLL